MSPSSLLHPSGFISAFIASLAVFLIERELGITLATWQRLPILLVLTVALTIAWRTVAGRL